MISSQKPISSAEFQVWAKEKQDHAQTLCKNALEFANELFQNGDLRPYLDVLSRLHTYNFYNLLLILQQYPEASCLAPFQEWKNQCTNGNMQVLKTEYRGKGIELIVPFTEPPRNKNRALFWFSVKQFDISQTRIAYKRPPSVYQVEAQNTAFIETALCRILSKEFSCSMIMHMPAQTSVNIDSPGFRNEKVLYCNPEVSVTDRILWLLENLLLFSDSEHIVGSAYNNLFISLVSSCLCQIWNLSEYYYLYQDADLIRSIPKNNQPLILDQLQVFVRRYAELVHCTYLEQRRIKDDDSEISQLPEASGPYRAMRSGIIRNTDPNRSHPQNGTSS